MTSVTYTVSEVTAVIKKAITAEPILRAVFVEGEVSNVRIPSSGHMYFTIKDQGASLKCVCFRFQRQHIPFLPEHGMTVLVHGKIDLYTADGAYQLYVDSIDPSGVGALALAIRQRMELLSNEGLFDERLKRSLPMLPRIVAVVTSATGAAVQDVCNVITRRAPMVHIVVIPTVVQGDGAVSSLLKSLQRAQQLPGVDVILLVRGGGSFEDLIAFQDEQVARMIRRGTIPVVTGIGHEIDTTIADYAADRRAPTPSAAAEVAVPLKSQLLEDIATKSWKLLRATRQESALKHQELDRRRLRLLQVTPSTFVGKLHQDVDSKDYKLKTLFGRYVSARHDEIHVKSRRFGLLSPLLRVERAQAHLVQAKTTLVSSVSQQIHLQMVQLDSRSGQLETLSPLKTISRGYAITHDARTQALVSSVHDTAPGQELETILKDGKIRSRVMEIHERHTATGA